MVSFDHFFCLLREHITSTCKKPIRGDSAFHKRHEPPYLKEPSSEVLSLSIEMRLIDTIFIAEVGNALDELQSLAYIKRIEEAFHYCNCIIAIYSCSTHNLKFFTCIYSNRHFSCSCGHSIYNHYQIIF